MSRIVPLFFLLAATVFETAHAEEDSRHVISLNQAMVMVLETDERIDIQRHEADIAGMEINRAWTIISPRLEATGAYERPEEAIQFDGRDVIPEETWRATFTARQPIFDGRVMPARRLGIALESSEDHELANTIRTALYEVVQVYYEALRAQKQVSISEQTLDLASAEVARAQARFDTGEIRRTEVLRTEVDESIARRSLITARNEYQLALSDLSRRIGMPADTLFAVKKPDIVPHAETHDLKALYSLALDYRNDLASARARKEAAYEERTVLKREDWPTLSVEYNHRFIDPDSFTTRNNFWEVAAVARMEFWDGGGRRISRVQQERRMDQAALRIRELERSIEIEIKRTLLELETLEENLETIRKEVDLAEENYRTLSEQAGVGLATSLDVSTALNALDRARTELAQQQFDLEVAKYNLEMAIGRFANELILGEE